MRTSTTMARTSFWIVMVILMGLASGAAQVPKVRTSIATKGDLFVGQKATLAVELLAPGYFASAPAFDLPNAPGLILSPPVGSPVVSTETIDEVSYTVQRHEVAVFTRRAGEQTIPAFSVRFKFKRNPLDKEEVAATVKTDAVKLTAKAPPGAEKLGNIISARDLKVEETWKPEPGKAAKAGDAFTRTITYTAPEVPAMAFPPFPTGKIDGLGIYAKEPEVLDTSNRGDLMGKRRDTITYVCQRPGKFVVPATRMTWFDLVSQKLQTIDFPARTFEVAPNPAMASGGKAGPNAEKKGAAEQEDCGCSLSWGLIGALALNLGLLGVAKMYPRWSPWFDVFRPVRLAPLNPPATKC